MGFFRSQAVHSLLVYVVVLCLVLDLGCRAGVSGLGLEQAPPKGPSVSKKAVFSGLRPMGPTGGGDLVGWEMRSVPSGPDPLHHNSSPKKPQTP